MDFLIGAAFFLAYILHKRRVGFAWEDNSDKVLTWKDHVTSLGLVIAGCLIIADKIVS